MRGPLEESFDIGDRFLVVFDGHCGLCTGSVRWLMRRDLRDRLRFAALDSTKVAGLLARHSLSGLELTTGTVLVVRDAGGSAESVLLRSDAVVELLRELPRPWPWAGTALRWIPGPMRDLGYRLVARWRHRIWGRLESCPLPAVEDQGRFL